ncbi:retrotransposon protein, putative, ty1-copia subclass [Tanacetum coccineum]
MVSTKKVDKTPYELWYVKVPNLSYLKIWRCEALVKRDTPDKLQQRSVKSIFIGYPKEMIGYYFNFPSENKIVVARYAEFVEINLIISQEVEGFEPPQEEDIPIRRSIRTHQAPERLCRNIEVEDHSLGDLNQPTNYKATLLDLESYKWLDAMNVIFKKKTDIDGIVHTYKAHLVAKGYTQTYKVDYEETFSPVADIRAIRILIDVEAFYDYEIFIWCNLKVFVDPNHPKKVCNLQRFIYGLKQASRSCNKRFDEEIKRFGFAQNLDEPCVYQKASGSNVTFLILYVDDIIIMGSHIPSLQSVKTYLGKYFAMTDLGEADDNSKHGYISMQERLDLKKTQSASTPGELKCMKNVPYALVVGSIINPEVELRVDCYCNVGFETDRDEIKSQARYVFILNERRSRLEKLQAKYYCNVRYIS